MQQWLHVVKHKDVENQMLLYRSRPTRLSKLRVEITHSSSKNVYYLILGKRVRKMYSHGKNTVFILLNPT